MAAALSRAPAVRVWDPLVRLFHWSLVTCFALAWLSEPGERLHEVAGYVVLALIAVRVVWGFVGSRYARFRSFVPAPRELLGYLRRMVAARAERHHGHNPAGGAMIVALLAMLALTAGSGWLMITDRFWGVGWVEQLHDVAAWVTLALVGAHVAGVVVSSLAHRENLVRAMITGRKRAEPA
jgi:cytochrome b